LTDPLNPLASFPTIFVSPSFQSSLLVLAAPGEFRSKASGLLPKFSKCRNWAQILHKKQFVFNNLKKACGLHLVSARKRQHDTKDRKNFRRRKDCFSYQWANWVGVSRGVKAEVEGKGEGTVLDLEHVTLVDVEGVRFLSECEALGIELVHCSQYIREWIARERHI
jgi:hypothetical protein